jgi:hypothetical protein
MDFLQAEIERKAKQLKQNEVTAVCNVYTVNYVCL